MYIIVLKPLVLYTVMQSSRFLSSPDIDIDTEVYNIW